MNPDTLRHMHLKHACLPFHHLSNLRKVESGTPGHQCKKKAFVPTLAKRGIFANSRPAMSPDPADSSRPPEDSIKPIDLSSLGFGPSWVDGPNENIAPVDPRADLVVRPAVRVVRRVVPAVLVVLHAVHAMTVVVLVAMTAVIASNPNRPSRRWW